MLFELKTIQDLSLREIDETIENIADCGYEGVILPRSGSRETLQGFCRSAGRHKLKLWLRDDMDDPSGSFGGEVTSVPSFCSDNPGLWGCNPYSSEAAEAFLDCSYVEMKRNLSRFMGYELTGVVTRFGKADEAFTETHLRPINEFCKNNGLELISQTDFPAPYGSSEITFADFTDMSFAQRQQKLCTLYAKGAKSVAAQAELYPDIMESLWIAGAGRLSQWLVGEPEPVELGTMAVKFTGGAYLLYNGGEDDVFLSINLESLGVKYVADCLTGGVYLPDSVELSLTLKEGGSLVLLAEAAATDPLPTILSCGAVFCELVKTEEVETAILSSDGYLAYRAELPEGCGGKYLQLEGDFGCAAVKLGRRKERLLLPPFTLPLYAVDEGRTAEIVVFPGDAHDTVSFALNKVNIVCAKNPGI